MTKHPWPRIPRPSPARLCPPPPNSERPTGHTGSTARGLPEPRTRHTQTTHHTPATDPHHSHVQATQTPQTQHTRHTPLHSRRPPQSDTHHTPQSHTTLAHSCSPAPAAPSCHPCNPPGPARGPVASERDPWPRGLCLGPGPGTGPRHHSCVLGAAPGELSSRVQRVHDCRWATCAARRSTQQRDSHGPQCPCHQRWPHEQGLCQSWNLGNHPYTHTPGSHSSDTHTAERSGGGRHGWTSGQRAPRTRHRARERGMDRRSGPRSLHSPRARQGTGASALRPEGSPGQLRGKNRHPDASAPVTQHW